LKYSGNLIIDDKCIPVKKTMLVPLFGKIPRSKKRKRIKKVLVLIWGVDYFTHDIPNSLLAPSENEYDFDNFFRELKLISYPLISLTIDDRRALITCCKHYYPKAVIQLCLKHYLANINRVLTISNIQIKIRSKEKKLEKWLEDIRLTNTRPRSTRQAIKLINEIINLEFKYELLLDFQELMFSILQAKTFKQAKQRITSLEKYFLPKRLLMNFPKNQFRKIAKVYQGFRKDKPYLFNHLKYPHLHIPKTTNLIESYNSHLELRLSSIRGFESEKTARNYINAWIIKRRFSKLTCCRKHFKKLNGKSPLEHAGVDIKDIQWLKKCVR